MDARSLSRHLFRRLAVALRRVPKFVRRLWSAAVLNGLAAACWFAVRGTLEHWPGAMLSLLLGSLLVWVVPRARASVLARVGEALLVAGAVLVAVLAGGAAAWWLQQLAVATG